MITTLYRGTVKDLRGPVRVGGEQAVVFEYGDTYSVFDWGRMPDLLPKKGEALAVLAAFWFERLEDPELWKVFSKTPEALALRKANRFGSNFNEIGELLQTEGLRTHYLGVATDAKQLFTVDREMPEVPAELFRKQTKPFRHLLVKQVSVVKPSAVNVLGRSIPDYAPTRAAAYPKLVPLEVVFRFSCPPGSSLIERAAKNPDYMGSIGFQGIEAKEGEHWEFPVLEMFTKLESTDRPVGLAEALTISGLPSNALQTLLLKTAWVAGILRWLCAQAGLELADGKLEWGVSAPRPGLETPESFLVDAIGPDELRLLFQGVQLSKEFLRELYRTTPWYDSINQAKKNASLQGSLEWKRSVSEGPPPLSAEHKVLASQLYLALTNRLTGKNWFSEAWTIEKVATELSKVQKSLASGR